MVCVCMCVDVFSVSICLWPFVCWTRMYSFKLLIMQSIKKNLYQ